jgi:nitrous oxidase accessory protein
LTGAPFLRVTPDGGANPVRRARGRHAPAQRRRPEPAALALLVLAALAPACSSGVPPLPAVPAAIPTAPPPDRPPGCRPVEPGADLAARLATARPGDAFCLEPGTYPGPLRLPAGVTLWGPRSAVIASAGSGDTVVLAGPGARLAGVTVDGSGGRFDLQEAAVHVTAADGAAVEGVRIVHALFGVIVEKSRDVRVTGNEIAGSGREQIGLRGDSIRVWETRGARIEGNRVSGARDIVVWYSSDNEIVGNEVTGGRYGTHFMYRHGNRVTGNRYVGNVVGIFVMYSRDIRLEGNLLAASAGAAGIGLGVKDSSSLTVLGNALIKNTAGVYLDNSPFEPGTVNRFEENAIRLCDVGVGFHASVDGNVFRANSLRGNATQVRVDGGGDALGNEWSGNDWDDYAGYDLDRDGVGDVAYELRSLSGNLRARHPQLDYLRGAPSLFLVDAASQLLPIVRPTAVLVDPRPLAGRGTSESSRAH